MKKSKQLLISVAGSVILTLAMRTIDYNLAINHNQIATDAVCEQNGAGLASEDPNTLLTNMNRDLLAHFSADQFCVLVNNEAQRLTAPCAGRLEKEYQCKGSANLKASIFVAERKFSQFNFIRYFSMFFIIIEILMYLILKYKNRSRRS
jgi:hypothetical protein